MKSEDLIKQLEEMVKEFPAPALNPLRFMGGVPIFESQHLPKAKTSRRVEWITRGYDGQLRFNHALRSQGSEYRQIDRPRNAYYMAGLGIVMRPEDKAALIRMVD